MHVIAYTDGSCKPNPGFAGCGIHGYVYVESDKKKYPKHPGSGNVYFTERGYESSRSEKGLDIMYLFEAAIAIEGNRETNNRAEVQAALYVLERFKTVEDITTITIITDSSYVTNACSRYLPTWIKDNWKRRDGQPVAHVDLWKRIHDLQAEYKNKGIDVKLQWVQGHNGDHGNELSDTLANIGSNASLQFYTTKEPFKEIIAEYTYSLEGLRLTYKYDDMMLHFKQMIFNTDPRPNEGLVHPSDETLSPTPPICYVENPPNCFLYNPPKTLGDIGTRTRESLYGLLKGTVRPVIWDIVDFYRSIPRKNNALSFLDLGNVRNKEFLRLADRIPVKYLLERNEKKPTDYRFIGTKETVVAQYTRNHTLIQNVSDDFITLVEYASDLERTVGLRVTEPVEHIDEANHFEGFDLTEYFFSDNKLILTTQDKSVDLLTIQKKSKILNASPSKLNLYIGYDIPSYLVMKRMEEEVSNVSLFLCADRQTYSITCVVVFSGKRTLVTVNRVNNLLYVPGKAFPIV